MPQIEATPDLSPERAVTPREVPQQPAARRPRRLPRWVAPSLTVLVVLALFEALSRTGLIASEHFPPVSETLRTLGEQLGTASFWHEVAGTLQGWALGLGLATLVAIPLGILIGTLPALHRATRVVIEFLRPIPSVALIPLVVLVWGTGLDGKVFLVAFAALWPLLMQTLYGVRDVDPVSLDTARAFGYRRDQRLVRVVLPSALPYIGTGLRISSATALILSVTAELVIGSDGLGQAINIARSSGAVALTYALIVATGLLGLILNGIFMSVERRLLHWHPSQRSTRVTA